MLVHVLFKDKPRYNFLSKAKTYERVALEAEERSMYISPEDRPIGYLVYNDYDHYPVCFRHGFEMTTYSQLEQYNIQSKEID